ncbi:lectin-like domain-containing protein [Telmatospirillum sp.]|uniref:PEP-CTERM sorting domain-containing protein n=1 Tax=Telmatospirillum sp. TaxID=2079197 RepID=UPI00283D94A1|nr:PEP-CTERM sorting domain-containing protein [Telmatospirillum sp.]MDR3435662.1 PEP-CTERM sorting domain-containing protein [Telmatospirillum sp.]
MSSCGYRAYRSLSAALAVGIGTTLLGAAPAEAGTIAYNGFANTSGLTFSGSAATATTSDGTVLRVTGDGPNKAGAVHSTAPITLGANDMFSTQFQFRFTDVGGVDPADGITLVLAASPKGLGIAGYGMGYAGVANSVAIEFDTYNNGNAKSRGYFSAEPNSSNHVAIDLNGVLTNTAWTNVYGNGSCGFSKGTPAQNTNTAAGCMSNGDLWTVDVSYDGTNLNVTLLDPAKGFVFDAITDYSINIGSYLGTSKAYVGFTGSTGAGWENHDIVNWEFADTATLPPTSVPEPGSVALLGIGLICLTRLRRRKPA